jgi:hypothetical protein
MFSPLCVGADPLFLHLLMLLCMILPAAFAPAAGYFAATEAALAATALAPARAYSPLLLLLLLLLLLFPYCPACCT